MRTPIVEPALPHWTVRIKPREAGEDVEELLLGGHLTFYRRDDDDDNHVSSYMLLVVADQGSLWACELMYALARHTFPNDRERPLSHHAGNNRCHSRIQ